MNNTLNTKKMRYLIIAISILIFGCSAQKQDSMPVIKANSELVDIKDGDNLNKNAWTINAKINPDVYHTMGSGHTVTFYTDIDSISVKVEKDTKFDFIIKYDGKDAITRIEYKEPYIITLQNAKEYDYTQKREIPEFKYLSIENEDLKKLCKEYNLDSVAGTGDEISKMIKIMRWVHNTVRHDGGSNNPKLKNASDLIKVCKAENRGVNCRMLATILNECYLSMGYKSRAITCMPKPLKFNDCHVINMVYSTQLNKWIWLDPTFEAYVTDENGVMLGLFEVRERLINNKPLILNPDANWNHKQKQTKEGYLDNYMAKNLYRLETPAFSTYNTESYEPNKKVDYIQLLPLDGLNQKPEVKRSKAGKSYNATALYVTNNPDQFFTVE